MRSISVIIPTYQGENLLPRLFKSLRGQTLFPDFETIVIDSSSQDATPELARAFGACVISIPKQEFNHGLTRTLGAKKAKGRYVVFLTQDTYLAHPEALERLLAPLQSAQVAASYGRQIAPPELGVLAQLHRFFNYPPRSRLISYRDRKTLGLRAVFASNSFAAYKRKALAQIGWFPALPASEDMYAFARLLKQGFWVAYVADAVVFHGHRLSLKEEFRRYVKIGSFHAQQSWILQEFGYAQGEGWKYLRFMLPKLMRKAPFSLPYFFFQTLIRYAGYKWGQINAKKGKLHPKASAPERSKEPSFS